MKIVKLKISTDLNKLRKLLRKTLSNGETQTVEEWDPHSSMIEMFGSIMCPKELEGVIRLVQQGFERGLKPALTNDGTSGTYFLRGIDKKPKAVFKPIDEEAFAPNNPRGYVGAFGQQTLRSGVLSGEACIREVAAYMIDNNFSGVPPTTMVEATHDSFRKFIFSNFKIISECKDYVDMISSIIAPENQTPDNPKNHDPDQDLNNEHRNFLKIGSLQKFVIADGTIEDYGCDLFDTDEIHKIAILDLRILNLDRNEGNILVQTIEDPNEEVSLEISCLQTEHDPNVKRRLIPIDHGMCIPDNL